MRTFMFVCPILVVLMGGVGYYTNSDFEDIYLFL